MRKLITTTLGLTLALSGAWAMLALYRWEWTRALWMTMAFVVAEVALVAVLLTARLQDLAERVGRLEPGDPRVRSRLAETRPTPDRFDWLREHTTQLHVFVTMILGGGVILSAILWVVDRVAGRTMTASLERRLAGQLSAIAFPADGLVPQDAVLLAADLDRPDREDLLVLLTGRTGHER